MSQVKSNLIQHQTLTALKVVLQREFQLDSVKLSTTESEWDSWANSSTRKPTDKVGFLILRSVSSASGQSVRENVTANKRVVTRYLEKTNIEPRDKEADSHFDPYNAEIQAFIPCIFKLDFKFNHPDWMVVLDLITRWHLARVKSSLDITLEYKQIPIAISVNLDDEPNLDEKPKPGQNATLMSNNYNIIVKGYLSSPDTEDNTIVPIIRTVNKDILIIEENT